MPNPPACSADATKQNCFAITRRCVAFTVSSGGGERARREGEREGESKGKRKREMTRGGNCISMILEYNPRQPVVLYFNNGLSDIFLTFVQYLS